MNHSRPNTEGYGGYHCQQSGYAGAVDYFTKSMHVENALEVYRPGMGWYIVNWTFVRQYRNPADLFTKPRFPDNSQRMPFRLYDLLIYPANILAARPTSLVQDPAYVPGKRMYAHCWMLVLLEHPTDETKATLVIHDITRNQQLPTTYEVNKPDLSHYITMSMVDESTVEIAGVFVPIYSVVAKH